MNGFKILLIALCLDPAAITDLTGASWMCTLQNFGGASEHSSLGWWEMFRPSLYFIWKKNKCHKTRCLPNPKSCPCVSVYTERVVSCKDILSSKRWEIDSTSQHLLCFAFSVMRFGQSVDVISDPVGILPCSIYILNVYPVLVLFWTLADITSSQCTHHSASVSFFQIFFTVDTSSVYKVFLEGAGNQLIPSLALDSEVF